MGEKLKRLRDTLRERTGTASMIEVYATREFLLTGCLGLVDFSESEVVADTVNGLVRVFGEELCITAYRADLLYVEGNISKVIFGGEI